MKRFLILVLTVLLFFTISCENDTVSGGEGKGAILLNLGDSISRGVNPSISLEIAEYKVSIWQGDDVSAANTLSSTSSAVVFRNLNPGVWNIKAEGYNKDGKLLGSGTTTSEVVAWKETKANITIKEIEGNGTFKAIVDWKYALSSVPLITVRLHQEGIDKASFALTTDGNSASGEMSILNGYYEIEITSDNPSLPLLSADKSVRIFVDAISVLHCTVDNDGSITITISNEVLPTPSTSLEAIVSGNDLVFTGNATNMKEGYSIQWYRNDEKLNETGNILTLPLSGLDKSDVITFKVFSENPYVVWTSSMTLEEIMDEAIFTFENGVITGLSDYGKSLSSLYIPSSIKGEEITTIGESAFRDCIALERVIIEEGITTLGSYAFLGAEKLSILNLPESLVSIGSYALGGSAIEYLYIPSSLSELDDFALANMYRLKAISVNENNSCFKSEKGNLYSKDGSVLYKYTDVPENQNIRIKDGVKVLKPHSFVTQRCTSVTLPEGLTTILVDAFCSLPHLGYVNIPSTVIAFGEDGNPFNGIRYLEINNQSDAIKVNGDFILSKDGKKLISYIMPMNYQSSVVIPEGVEEIGSLAFYGLDLINQIVLPGSVKRMNDFALSGLISLENVNIPSSLTSVGEGVFRITSGMGTRKCILRLTTDDGDIPSTWETGWDELIGDYEVVKKEGSI